MSYEASATIVVMRSRSLNVSTLCIFGLFAWLFFLEEGFCGEAFLFLVVSDSSIGFLGGVTSP